MMLSRGGFKPLLAIVAVVVVCSYTTVEAADILCYACNSYMSQCQHPTLAAGTSNVFQARCTSKCFTRQGEDDAIYRGCFDAFKAVKQLSDDYVGCRNQTWNNRVRRWCLCDTDLCNAQSINDEQPAPQKEHQQQTPNYQQQQQQQQPQYQPTASNIDTSNGETTSYTVPTSHHTHHTVVHQQSYPPPPQPTQYVSAEHDSRQAGGRQSYSVNATEKTADPSRYQVYPPNTAEYRTVWNNWLVGDADRSHATTEATNNMQNGGNIDSNDGGWIDAPRGVLHSVHHNRQPTWNYGDVIYSDNRPADREAEQGAKSSGPDSDRHGVIEPISNPAAANDTLASERTGRDGLPSDNVEPSTTGQREEYELLNNGQVVERITVQNGQVVERIAVNNPRIVEQGVMGEEDSTVRQHGDGYRGEELPAKDETQSRRLPVELTIEVDGDLIDNGTSAENLEYPYNQEFVSHPISWAPIEYEPKSSDPAVYESPSAMKQAPESIVDKDELVENKDYPYNQYKERLLDDNYNDNSETFVALKEGPSEVEEQVEDALDKLQTIDYPYNQLMILDNSGNPTSDLHDEENFNSTEKNRRVDTRQLGETIKYTVHSDLKTRSALHRRHHDSRSINEDTTETTSTPDQQKVLRLPVSSATDERQPWVRPDELVVHHQQEQPHQQQYEKQVHQHLLMPPQPPTVLPASGANTPHNNVQSKYLNHGHTVEILHTKSSVHRPSQLSAPSYPGDAATAAATSADVIEMTPLKTKDQHRSMPRHRQQRRHGGESRQDGGVHFEGPHAKEATDDGVDYEKMDSHTGQQNAQVPQIQCSQTGYYQNPKDCTQFVACLFDHNTRTKVLHLMRCPSGLVWDNLHKLCMEMSSTCREGISQADLDNNYLQFFADVNAVSSSTGVSDGINERGTPSATNLDHQQHLLNDIRNKHEVNNK